MRIPILLLAGAVAVVAAPSVRSETVPAPTTPLKDYQALGVMHVELPPPPAATGEKNLNPGFSAFYPFRQVYVRPDKVLTVLQVGPTIQAMLAMGDTERVWNPALGYVVQRSFKNLDPAAPSPMDSVQYSMATYARLLREITTARLLPAEDLAARGSELRRRIEELRVLREKLSTSKDPEDLPRAQAAAAEQARVRDDLEQLDLRKLNPCHIVEIPNRDLLRTLLTRGLVGPDGETLLGRGKTTVWITKAEGLPIKLETTGNDGRVVLFVILKDFKINSGLHPSEVVLGNPPGTRLISATADMRDRRWQQKMEESIARQIGALDSERATLPGPYRKPKRDR